MTWTFLCVTMYYAAYVHIFRTGDDDQKTLTWFSLLSVFYLEQNICHSFFTIRFLDNISKSNRSTHLSTPFHVTFHLYIERCWQGLIIIILIMIILLCVTCILLLHHSYSFQESFSLLYVYNTQLHNQQLTTLSKKWEIERILLYHDMDWIIHESTLYPFFDHHHMKAIKKYGQVRMDGTRKSFFVAFLFGWGLWSWREAMQLICN